MTDLNPERQPSAPVMMNAGDSPPADLPPLRGYTHKDTGRMLLTHYARTRDQEVRRQLILRHQKLVRYVAQRFVNSGESLDDLLQVGNIGLINALDRYDPTQNVTFSTFAVPTIVGEIKRHFRDKTWHIKVPRWLQELSIRAGKAEGALQQRLGRAPTLPEISAEIGASEEETIEALELARNAGVLSLDTPLDREAGHDSGTLADVIGRIDLALQDAETYADLRMALNYLAPRERRVLHHRFFEDLSQAQIARRMGLSQMHVSRLQQRGIERLRALLKEPPALASCRPQQKLHTK